MTDQYFVKVPYTEGHSHFAKWVKDFPQLHQHDDHHDPHGHTEHKPLPAKEKTLDYLRKELVDLAIDKKSIEQKLCYRFCFKMPDKEYAQYCLTEKCGQSNMKEAARALKLLK